MNKYEINFPLYYYFFLQCFEFILKLMFSYKMYFYIVQNKMFFLKKKQLVIKFITFARHDIPTENFTLSLCTYLIRLTLVLSGGNWNESKSSVLFAVDEDYYRNTDSPKYWTRDCALHKSEQKKFVTCVRTQPQSFKAWIRLCVIRGRVRCKWIKSWWL
jgi:hypothetical protein